MRRCHSDEYDFPVHGMGRKSSIAELPLMYAIYGPASVSANGRTLPTVLLKCRNKWLYG